MGLRGLILWRLQLREAAHKMHGSAIYCGLMSLAECSARLEQCALKEEAVEIQKTCSELEHLVSNLLAQPSA
ncbi:MAG: Hpt domain-containing protein [gamma proteobacterium symbiont of Bathyaustriella thionipta]|nr:Hpt domain-containing protein [gamma proteobacterium symbiont of Bathyaustriella thionipta]